jgi:hypothetical protein
VDLYDPGVSQSAAPRSELTTGQGVRVDRPGAESRIAADTAAFLTADELAARAARDTEARRREWAAALADLHKDRTLLVHYGFQTGPAGTRTLANEAAVPPRTADGAIVGAGWGAGRWADRRGLEFKRVSDRVRFTVPGEQASLTLAAWVRPDALPNQNNSLMMSDGWEPGAPHWQIGSDGAVILGIKAPPEFDGGPYLRGASYKATEVFTPERFGRWVHLAVVYDRDAGVVTHYVDGKPAAEQSIAFETPLRVGDAELGNWNVAGYRNKTPVRNFNGCMDEFLLFGRALGGPEIERLYAQGRPPL